jgi:ABC-type sugar transport system ATPase subunit
MARLRVPGGLSPGPDGAPRDLDVAEGELFVLAGPVRKWSRPLLRRIAGLQGPRLEVIVGDLPVGSNVPEQRGLGFVFASGALFPHLTVAENLAFGPRARRTAPFHVEEQVTEAARATGIVPLLGRLPGTLDAVERLRVATARVLARKPQAILFDDPLSGASLADRAALRDELVRLHRVTGRTFLAATPSVSDAIAVAHRLALFEHGRVRQIGNPLELVQSPGDRYVAAVTGTPSINLLAMDVAAGRLTFGGVTLTAPDVPRVVLGIRPDDLMFDRSGEALELRFAVDRVEIEGREARVALNATQRLWMRCESRCAPPPGTELPVYVDLRSLQAFTDDDAGGRIPWEFAIAPPVAVASEPEEKTLPAESASLVATVSSVPADGTSSGVEKTSLEMSPPPEAPPIEEKTVLTPPSFPPEQAVAGAPDDSAGADPHSESAGNTPLWPDTGRVPIRPDTDPTPDTTGGDGKTAAA